MKKELDKLIYVLLVDFLLTLITYLMVNPIELSETCVFVSRGGGEYKYT